MNERIKLLAEQAGAHFETRCLASNPVQYRESVELWDDRIEKFAELIVKECAGVDLYWLSEQDRKAIAEKIKQHFGVES